MQTTALLLAVEEASHAEGNVPLVQRLLKALHQLKESGLVQLMQFGETLTFWSVEIATMWRFTRRRFWERLPGILPHKRASEPFRRSVYRRHCDGINASRLSQCEGIGGCMVVRWTIDFLEREVAEFQGSPCPRVLGIDEHFFSRKDGYATTFCNLHRHTIFDVVLGRSEAALEGCLAKLRGKERVRVVCMDLSSTYRGIVRKYFPNARIVADRFHVICQRSAPRRWYSDRHARRMILFRGFKKSMH